MRYLVLLLFFAISGCASYSNINQLPDNQRGKAWPRTVPGAKATLVVVNPYKRDCCGASPVYKINVRSQDVLYRSRDLLPIEDFFCLNLSPGQYTVSLSFPSKPTEKSSISLSLHNGEVTFIAAEVDLRRRSKGPMGKVYQLGKNNGMFYVTRALDRWQKQNWSRKLINKRLSCPTEITS